MFYTGKVTTGLLDQKDERFLSYCEHGTEQFDGKTVQVVSYGIKDKHCGNVNIKLTLQSEVEKTSYGSAVEKGIDIRLDGQKEKVDEDDHEILKRSIQIDGDVKASLA